ncbi:hypothetical protein KKF34_00055 [Myxococcota bacterium]|nr:hypothetical protein [Myxococcota bacterium]MBU1382975.1 hypothetical protein [Myxococcota bacterium]MBU1495252.1 hypothetical protein [Myxococcota bacterium]
MKSNVFILLFVLVLFPFGGCDDDAIRDDLISPEKSHVETSPAFYNPQTQLFHATVTVTVNNAYGNPIKGAIVSLHPDTNNLSPVEDPPETDALGKSIFEVTGNQLGVNNAGVSATLSIANYALVGVAEITLEVLASIEPVADPSYIWDVGTFPLKMTIQDSRGSIVSVAVTTENIEVSPQSMTSDASGQLLFSIETHERGSIVLTFTIAGIEGTFTADAVLPAFGHGSVRPACLYDLDPNRTAYYDTPVIVSPDWSEAVKVSAPVTDNCPNDAISLSNDGQTLYMYWSPIVGGNTEQSLHIHTGTYYAQLTGEGPGTFSVPRFYDLNGGTGGSVDGALSFTPDGSEVIFHSTRSANLGFQENPPADDFLDMYIAPISGGIPGAAVNPGSSLNSIYLDGEHGLNADGSILYFSSDRPGGQGGLDIWFSIRDGLNWESPVNPGAPLNSSQWEGQPNFGVSEPDTIYFSSNRDGPSAIYRSVLENGSWTEPELLITGYVGEPTISPDGNILYFVHVLVDDDGVFGSNIWYVIRN